MRIIDFDIYKDLLKRESGLIITPEKSYLLESRLAPVAKKWNFENINGLTMALKGVPDQKLVIDVVEAMTTNETSFFRDTRPFDLFKNDVIPPLIEERKRTRQLKIWCAAASSGQEPYSLAMLIKEMQSGPLTGWRTDILGTDISKDILETAQKGVYSQFEVQRGLPIQLLMNYFTQTDEKWAIKDDIKKMVRYEYLNLLSPFSHLGKFDIVFCRNVLIYFDQETKKDVLERIHSQLPEDGFLFLGGAETIIGITDKFVPLPEKRGVYVPKGSPYLS